MHCILHQVADCHCCTLLSSIGNLSTHSSQSNNTDDSDGFMILPLPTQASSPTSSHSSHCHTIPLPTPSHSSTPTKPRHPYHGQLPLLDHQDASSPSLTQLSLQDANINRYSCSRQRWHDIFPRGSQFASPSCSLTHIYSFSLHTVY